MQRDVSIFAVIFIPFPLQIESCLVLSKAQQQSTSGGQSNASHTNSLTYFSGRCEDMMIARFYQPL